MTHPAVSSRPTWLGRAAFAAYRLPSRIMLALEGLRERSVLQHELGQLEAQGDLERVLSDAGISQSEMPQLLNGHPGAARQFTEMMSRVGVNSDDLPATVASTAVLRDMQRQCNSCQTWQECREWFASHATDDRYREFCPNAHTFEEIRDRQTHLHAAGEPGSLNARAVGGTMTERDDAKGQTH